jgi:hypothetical protein
MSLLLIIKIHALIKIDSKRDNFVTPMIMMFLQQHSSFLLVEGYLYPMLFIILWFGNWLKNTTSGLVLYMGQMMSKHMKHLIPVIQMYLQPRFLVRVRVTRSLVLCGVERCPFSFGHCVVCPSKIYGFWLPLWYLQTLLS